MQKKSEASALDAFALEPIFVTVKTACDLIGLRPTKLYELIKAGVVESTKVGGKRLLTYASLKNLATKASANVPMAAANADLKA